MAGSAGSRTARLLAVVLASLTTTSLTTSPAAPQDDEGLFLSVIAPGQGKSVSRDEGLAFIASGELPAHWTDQLEMYTGLPAAAPSLTDADLSDYFKPAGLGVPPDDVESVIEPKAGVTIARDSFGVPHITGETRSDAMWGAGYATGEDRLFVADILRHMGLGRTSALLGATPENLAQDEAMHDLAGYTDAELARQIDRMRDRGPIGAQVVADVEDYVAGINARIAEVRADPALMPFEYTALGVPLRSWTPADVVGVAILIQTFFALGGGGELRNAAFLDAARAELGPQTADLLWRDLRHMEEPEAPTTVDTAFPYMVRDDVNPRAVATPESDSVRNVRVLDVSGAIRPTQPGAPSLDPLEELRGHLARWGLSASAGASNWLAVTADASEGGRPIGVMGPQTGYYSPEIMMELELRAPDGLHARGMAFPGISMYIQIGRGPGFAWSATSGGSDLVDVRVARVCDPDGGRPRPRSTGYRYRGHCRPMITREQRWSTPAAGGAPTSTVTAHILRTRHGPVFARARVNGRPVALTLQRSTFKRDLGAAFPFFWANGWSGGQTDTAEEFLNRFSRMTGSFNWLYVDGEDVAYVHSGRYPIRAPGVDPDLPSWGTGRWEWQGFLPRADHPQEIAPGKGWITSWNNKPAPGWRAADSRWSYSTLYRSLALDERLRDLVPAGGVSVADVVRAMAEAATVDLRGQELVGLLVELLGAEAQSPGLASAVALLEAWAGEGGHRLDADGDGRYEHHAAVVLMDEWWPRLIHAIFDAHLAGLYDAIPLPFDDRGRENGGGSAFASGYYGHVQKALRLALGGPVAAPYQVLGCADGTTDGCGAAVAQSLRDAIAALGPDPVLWDPDGTTERGDRIRFTAFGALPTPAIPWQNRPTWQQVVQPAP